MAISDNVAIATIGAVATVMVSAVNAAFAWSSNIRSKRNEQHLIDAKTDVSKLVTQTDGITSSLIRLTGEAEHAKGVIEGENNTATVSLKKN